jgi:hypothetical protein
LTRRDFLLRNFFILTNFIPFFNFRFSNQTVMAIKAPPEAKLQVPHPSEGMQIHMKSDRGEIEVFLCPEEDALGSSQLGGEDSEDTDSETASPIKIKQESSDPYDSGTALLSSQAASNFAGSPPGTTWEAPLRNGDDATEANVLIWESEDFGPIGNRFQQQTVDQDHHGKEINLFIFRISITFECLFCVPGWFLVQLTIKIFELPGLLLCDPVVI